MKIIEFCDTTLRDGEQAPGNTMKPKDKLLIAKKLENIGVNVIEAGFPASSKEDFEAIKLISSHLKKATVCSFARCVEKDIDIANESTKGAKNRMLMIFYAISDIHLKNKYNTNRKDAMEKIKNSIRYSKQYFKRIKFGLEDATRADPKYLHQVINLLLNEGVDTIALGDTTGWITPLETFKLVKNVVYQVNGKVKISIHCHNDLGMATANTLSAIMAGVDEVDTTVNGIGERAGNTPFEEIVVSLVVRKDIFKRKINIKLNALMPLSELVYKIINRTPSHEKPIVGVNAFRHESGVHIDGIKKDPSTYEIFNPKKNWTQARIFIWKTFKQEMTC
ncbi:MAG: 2-isopropylmalate synthase [Candidatus Zambryskibacteria bacterium CG10_big_fil_rev_8_21_14_0_10_42_12]|uniref:2-isopropylmalate synthase n=1 Tax=Candidatus Zambryskibacteria bacterium CG10_big_fil_rev_8_21_14_0_10_42_12 TaxID=1975115 RepID=A0A2H0QXD9_9BACT|nr:MAG: 2-isopropylmalate synthase [Candidatus Zambryskibacteria bacterium CG10_big_fil_rev_8_21_14_0_10_42_12]